MGQTIAIFGDVHGHQDAMVREALRWQEEHQVQIDLILCVGDFQALRGEIDMRAMACPPKYQQVGDYPPYHVGEKSFPAEVVFIGGNHEAYNWLETMPAGGRLGPKCYYLGRWGVIERLGLRIAGLTGNYSPRAYESGRNPVNYGDPAVLANERRRKQSTYFTKPEVQALAGQGAVDLLLLHDWPAGLPELVESATTDDTPRYGVGNAPARWLLDVTGGAPAGVPPSAGRAGDCGRAGVQDQRQGGPFGQGRRQTRHHGTSRPGDEGAVSAEPGGLMAVETAGCPA